MEYLDQLLEANSKARAERDELRKQNAELLAALQDAFPLALAHAAVYQVTNELADLHPVHAEIIAKIQAAIARATGEKER